MALHARQSALPKIPGIYPSFTEIKDKYPIGSDLEVVDNVRLIKSIEKTKDQHLCTDPDIAMAMRAKGYDIVKKRPWMVMDREALCFDAYYKSTLLGSSGNIKYAVRKLKIYYFLVDDTIQVIEPVEPNSGTTQGCFVRRQKIPLPGRDQDTGPYYKLTDLNVGQAVIFYGKKLIITGVNSYTRDFLHKMGVQVLDNEPVPDDPYYVYRKETELDVVPKSKSKSIRSHRPNGFDDLVLRFRGYWDDRYEVEGELHFFDVLFYLVDGTMELVEELTDDNRPDAIIRRTFVKRQKLPMNGPWCTSPGINTRQEILNVIPDGLSSYHYKMDSRMLDTRGVTYYQCTDLFIGATLNVYSRNVVLVNCDQMTKDFYRMVYGLTNFEPIEAPKTRREIEEHESNKKRVETILKNHDEIMRKKLIKDGATGMVFAFVVKMVTDDPINKNRNFMLKYYLDDTDFAVYEYRETNSGVRGGMFRSKRGFDKTEDKRFVFHQLTVGAKVTVDDFEFVVVDVDDKTVKFMIDNPTEFPHSDLTTLKRKTLETINSRFESLDEFRTQCFHGRELVDKDEFRNVLSFGGALDAHVGIVFSLTYKRPEPFEPYTDQVLRSVVQDTLRKAQFVHFDGLKSNFKSRKLITDRGGAYLGRDESAKAIKSNKLPLSWEIIDALFNKFADAEHDGGINYAALVDFMDYVKYPVELPVGLAKELLFAKPKKVLVRVNEFVDALRSTTTTTTQEA